MSPCGPAVVCGFVAGLLQNRCVTQRSLPEPSGPRKWRHDESTGTTVVDSHCRPHTAVKLSGHGAYASEPSGRGPPAVSDTGLASAGVRVERTSRPLTVNNTKTSGRGRNVPQVGPRHMRYIWAESTANRPLSLKNCCSKYRWPVPNMTRIRTSGDATGRQYHLSHFASGANLGGYPKSALHFGDPHVPHDARRKCRTESLRLRGWIDP